MATVYTKQMQNIVNHYIHAGQKWPATSVLSLTLLYNA